MEYSVVLVRRDKIEFSSIEMIRIDLHESNIFGIKYSVEIVFEKYYVHE